LRRTPKGMQQQGNKVSVTMIAHIIAMA
jgi:hypothetical protein